jgi:type II secretory pathway component PulF
MKLAYQAFDGVGKSLSGVAEAANVAEAVETLRRQGLHVVEIKPAGAAVKTRSKRLSRGRRLRNLAIFTRQLSVLVSSGTPLVQALGALERQTKDAVWREIVTSVRVKVEEGISLADAMEDHPQAFDAVCRSLIAAGESGGGFDVMLERLAVLSKKQLQIRSAVLGAMVYPALLISVAVGVLALMLLFVLPRFADLFESLGAPLPPATQMLMTLSDALKTHWWTIPFIGGAAFFAGRHWINSKGGRRALDLVALKLPVLGAMTRNFAVARLSRILGVLVLGKVPLLDALRLTRQTLRNSCYVDLMERAEESVTRGGTISGVFATTDLINPALCEAIRSGESSGQMGPLLINIAEFLDEENEVVTKSLTSILEPLILVILGLIVGFVALSMFLPLFDLAASARS